MSIKCSKVAVWPVRLIAAAASARCHARCPSDTQLLAPGTRYVWYLYLLGEEFGPVARIWIYTFVIRSQSDAFLFSYGNFNH